MNREPLPPLVDPYANVHLALCSVCAGMIACAAMGTMLAYAALNQTAVTVAAVVRLATY